MPATIEECGIVGFDSALDDIERGDAKPNRTDILCALGLGGRERDHRLVARTGRLHAEEVWNPFSPDVPADALLVAPRIDSFCWRVENLAREGGFALITGAPGIGKSSALRLLVERLGVLREIKIGVMARPHMGV